MGVCCFCLWCVPGPGFKFYVSVQLGRAGRRGDAGLFCFLMCCRDFFRLTMDQTIDCCGQGGGLDVV